MSRTDTSKEAITPSDTGTDRRRFEELPDWLKDEVRERESGLMDRQVDHEIDRQKKTVVVALAGFLCAAFVFGSIPAAVLGGVALLVGGYYRFNEMAIAVLYSAVVIVGIGMSSLGSTAGATISLLILPFAPVLGFVFGKVLAPDPGLDN